MVPVLCCVVQGLAGEGKQAWAEDGPELVPHLHAVVAAVEGLCQIREYPHDVCLFTFRCGVGSLALFFVSFPLFHTF